jgi:hypothetical protein
MLVDFAIKSQLERSAAQEHSPPLSQVLVFLITFSYAYMTYIIKSQLERSAAQEHTPPLSQVGRESTERTSAFQIFYLVGWTLVLLQCPSR